MHGKVEKLGVEPLMDSPVSPNEQGSVDITPIKQRRYIVTSCYV